MAHRKTVCAIESQKSKHITFADLITTTNQVQNLMIHEPSIANP